MDPAIGDSGMLSLCVALLDLHLSLCVFFDRHPVHVTLRVVAGSMVQWPWILRLRFATRRMTKVGLRAE